MSVSYRGGASIMPSLLVSVVLMRIWRLYSNASDPVLHKDHMIGSRWVWTEMFYYGLGHIAHICKYLYSRLTSASKRQICTVAGATHQLFLQAGLRWNLSSIIAVTVGRRTRVDLQNTGVRERREERECQWEEAGTIKDWNIFGQNGHTDHKPELSQSL